MKWKWSEPAAVGECDIETHAVPVYTCDCDTKDPQPNPSSRIEHDPSKNKDGYFEVVKTETECDTVFTTKVFPPVCYGKAVTNAPAGYTLKNTHGQVVGTWEWVEDADGCGKHVKSSPPKCGAGWQGIWHDGYWSPETEVILVPDECKEYKTLFFDPTGNYPAAFILTHPEKWYFMDPSQTWLFECTNFVPEHNETVTTDVWTDGWMENNVEPPDPSTVHYTWKDKDGYWAEGKNPDGWSDWAETDEEVVVPGQGCFAKEKRTRTAVPPECDGKPVTGDTEETKPGRKLRDAVNAGWGPDIKETDPNDHCKDRTYHVWGEAVCGGNQGAHSPGWEETVSIDDKNPLPADCSTCADMIDKITSGLKDGTLIKGENYGDISPDGKNICRQKKDQKEPYGVLSYDYTCDGDENTKGDTGSITNAWTFESAGAKIDKRDIFGNSRVENLKFDENKPGWAEYGNTNNIGAYGTVCWQCDPSKALGSKTDPKEALDICCTRKGNMVWSPLLVDVEGLGYPDLLAGPNAWPEHRPLPQGLEPKGVYRFFEMEPGKRELWEWAGPKAGILVYAPDGRAPVGKITGASLFGNFTGGKKWADGYDALDSLDADRDGGVDGEELSKVFVWRDKNSDAEIQPEEIGPASGLIGRLSSFAPPTLFIEGGATLKDGRNVTTWDWWPAKYRGSDPVLDGDTGGAGATSPTMVWGLTQEPERAAGLLRFFFFDGTLYVATTGPDFGETRQAAVVPVRVERAEDFEGEPTWRLIWQFSPPSLGKVSTTAVYSAARKTLLATTAGPGTMNYDWVASPAGVSGPLPEFLWGLASAPDAAWGMTVVEGASASSPGVLVPVTSAGNSSPAPSAAGRDGSSDFAAILAAAADGLIPHPAP